MKITNVKIRRIGRENGLRAVAASRVDDCFVVHEIRLIDGKEGLFVAMPSRKVNDGSFMDVAHPINIETRRLIEKMIIEKYNETNEEQAA